MSRPAEKYRYQEIVWGRAGLDRVRAARVGVFGLGGTGSHHAHLLARAGVGFLRLVDRDVVERGDLHRTALYTEEDAAQPVTKAAAAARRIVQLNADVRVEPVVAYVGPHNVLQLAADLDLLVDGADNFPLRFLLNDAAVKTGRPLIYQGAVGGRGAAMAIVPGVGPCLRCLLPTAPAPGSAPTCAQVGVSPAAVAAAAAAGAARSFAVLRGDAAAVAGLLTRVEEDGGAATVRVARRADCPCCGCREFPFLRGELAAGVNAVCGGRAWEVFPGRDRGLDLEALWRRLAGRVQGKLAANVLILSEGEITALVFADGRALVYGAGDAGRAQAVYDRWIGA